MNLLLGGCTTSLTAKEIEPAKTFLYDQLSADSQSKVVWRDTFWNADEAISVYARAHALFGMEPHSLIMGVTLGVPIIRAWPPSHGRKAWMFRDIGLPDWLCQVDHSSAADWTNQKKWPEPCGSFGTDNPKDAHRHRS